MTPGNWSRSPKHLLRLSAIDDVLADLEPGRFLEIGAGNGDITRRLAQRGFTGTAYDLGVETRDHLRKALTGTAVEVVDDLSELDGSFDYLFAFEVLEHIDADDEALRSWTEHLSLGGSLVVSVPAHQRKYGVADQRVGHVRRYEAAGLVELLSAAGYGEATVLNYGFPLGNITRHIQQGMATVQAAAGRRGTVDDCDDPVQRSIRSGIETSRVLNVTARLLPDGAFSPAARAQRWFYGKDWGDGYVARAVRIR